MIAWLRAHLLRSSLPRCWQCRALIESGHFCGPDCEHEYVVRTAI